MPEGTEIERKFLLPRPPAQLDRFPATRIEQGYLAITDEVEVRVRRRDRQATLTVKSTGGGTRVEEELEIDARRFAALWPLTEGRRVVKVRHELPAGDGLTIELDVYEGALAGLVTAEVEFAGETDSAAYEPPDWLGTDVTEDVRFKNRTLALSGRPR
ncbi:MAG: adenylate cyclase [Conexibacter sp.]|jgi:CYTH domain-containing protein|nr:adenylate cyclase [Conexibacter sp.]